MSEKKFPHREHKLVMRDVMIMAPEGYFPDNEQFQARVITPIAYRSYLESPGKWWASVMLADTEVLERCASTDQLPTKADWLSEKGFPFIVDLIAREDIAARTYWPEVETMMCVAGYGIPGTRVGWMRPNGRFGWTTIREKAVA